MERSETPSAPDPYLSHWADHAATKTIAAHPGEQRLTVAAGITPSGVVHIGNFREVITVDLVARALRDRGVDVRFIYSWDDFDVFRKVPANMPNQALLTENLGRSIVDVPDPFGEHKSYADHNISAFERSLAPLGIAPEFIRQSQRYRAGDYARGIHTAMRERETLRDLLNEARARTGARTRLPSDWLPLYGFCDECGRDQLRFEITGEWTVRYTCERCAHEAEVDLRRGANVKLPWRVDWPMRWAEENVAFEPGGKDHSSAGGSYDTAKDIVRAVYGGAAPQYVGYDFVRVKGRGGKISSSKGDVVTIDDCLQIYEPELLRWIFVGTRYNRELQISFDLDVIKLYEDYDRTRRLAYSPLDGSKADKKRRSAQRIMQLSSPAHERVTPGGRMPFQPQFRHLSMILQIHDGAIEPALRHYEQSGQLETEDDRRLCRQRARCVWNWIERYAPPEFRYRIRQAPVVREISVELGQVLTRLVYAIKQTPPELREAGLVPHMKALFEGSSLTSKDFFPLVYDLLIDRSKGPKLTTLLVTMGRERALSLLSPTAQVRASVPDPAYGAYVKSPG
jgi:lysyl-tRNA synthetase class 1